MKKGKLFTTLSMLVLTIACLTFGVFAMISASFTANGTITFNAYELDVLVQGEIIGAIDNGSLQKSYKNATISNHGKVDFATSGNGTLPTWSMGGLGFDELNENNFIIIKFVITNYSKYAIEASATINNQAGLEENMDIDYAPMVYCYEALYSGDTPTDVANGELFISFKTKDGVSGFTSDLSISIDIKPTSKTPTSGFDTTEENNEITITNYRGSETEIIIPRTINGNPVTTVGTGSYVFGDNWGVKSIVLPDTLTAIGDDAFGDVVMLDSFKIPGSVEFLYASSIPNMANFVTISNGVRVIRNTFYCCEYKWLSIPQSIEFIQDCYASSVTFAMHVNGNRNIKYLGCTDGNGNFIPTTLWDARGSSGDVDDIPSTCRVIVGCSGYDNSFVACYDITSITLPEGLIGVGDNAFNGTSLSSIIIPSTVIYLGNGAFDLSGTLTQAQFNNSIGWQVSSDGEAWEDITGTLPSTEMCESNATLLTGTYVYYFWRRG